LRRGGLGDAKKKRGDQQEKIARLHLFTPQESRDMFMRSHGGFRFFSSEGHPAEKVGHQHGGQQDFDFSKRPICQAFGWRRPDRFAAISHHLCRSARPSASAPGWLSAT
jgi:hypothetical protein